MAKQATAGPVRLPTAERDAIAARAKSEGKKMAEIMREASALYVDLHMDTQQAVEAFANGLGIRPGLIIDAILTRYFADLEAQEDVYNDLPPGLPDEELAPLYTGLRGKALFDWMKPRLVRQHEQQREEVLKARLFDGGELTLDEAEWLQTHSPSAQVARAQQSQQATRELAAQLRGQLLDAGFSIAEYIPASRFRRVEQLHTLYRDGTLPEDQFRALLSTLAHVTEAQFTSFMGALGAEEQPQTEKD